MKHRVGLCALLGAIAACYGYEEDALPEPVPATALEGTSWPLRYEGSPSSLRRLSRDELVTSMREVTGAAPSRTSFPAEPRQVDGPLLTGGLAYIATEVPTLQTAVSEFTTAIAPKMLSGTACKSTAQGQRDCLQKWALAFSERVLRRTLRVDEGAKLQAVLASADGTVANDLSVVEDVLTSVFLSPSFLYRTEIGTPIPNRAGIRKLTAIELSTRLSFLSTMAPPDAALRAFVSTGGLDDAQTRVREFNRLVRSDLGKRAVSVLVLEWLGANEPSLGKKSAKYTDGLPQDYENTARLSADASIVRALFDGKSATLASLFSQNLDASDPVIAAVARMQGMGATVTGDTAETARTGLLMHPQVLAAHTKEDGVSPFQIGVFLRKNLLCEAVSPPPPGATAKALPDVPGQSMRENFEHKVSVSGECKGCHAQFAPLGYAFLPFDPVGRWFARDVTGKAWDLKGSIDTYSGPISFDSPKSLSQNFGQSVQVQGCFAQAALSWSLGRRLVKEDNASILAIDEVVKRTNGDVLEVLRTIVAAHDFTTAVAGKVNP
jgi:hypothetical protein